MKICMLTSIFPRYLGDHCGAGNTVYEMSKNLISVHGLDVKVVAPNDDKIPKFEVMNGIEVFRFSYFWPRQYQKLAYGAGIPANLRNYMSAKIQLIFFIINFFLRAFSVVRKSDIIHIQWLLNGIVGVTLSKIFHKPSVISVRRVVPSGKIMQKLIKIIAENSDYIIFNSSYTRDELLKFSTPKKYCIIPSTLNLQKFKSGKSTKLRRKINLPDDSLIILYIGYLIEKKGVCYLIEVMSDVIKKIKNVHLVIGGDGFEAEKLKKLVKKHRLDHSVTFLGWVDHNDLPDYYRDADLFVLPSIIDSKGETETLGMVLVEAMASGVPVIGSKVGGIPDVIKPNVGLLTEPKNPADIAQKLLHLLPNKTKRQKMGLAGVKWAHENFSWENISKHYLKVYQEII